MQIRWDLLNDQSFVHLVADLLRRLGFVDVNVQGDGPDGGLDILATELVPFAFHGPRPLRWGIQCKYSRPGGRRAVTDNEIRDVVGILRSKRYESYGLGGYMVVTNRRVSQNVIERLLGIDSTSEYRASWLDGAKLEQYLCQQLELLDNYFGRVIQEIEKLTEEQTRERQAEKGGDGDFLFRLVADEQETAQYDEYGDLTGTFESQNGFLKLEHSLPEQTIYGQYTYHSDEFVGEIIGEFYRGMIQYRFQWFEKEISGAGVHLVSPDGDRLEGLWVSEEYLDNLTIEQLWNIGNRSSYKRV